MDSQPTTGRTLQFVAFGAVVLFSAVLLVVSVVGIGGMSGWRGGMVRGYYGYQRPPLGGIAMLLVWLVVLGGGGYLIYRWLPGRGGGTTDPALEQLRVEYARGNISDEDYERRRDKLQDERNRR